MPDLWCRNQALTYILLTKLVYFSYLFEKLILNLFNQFKRRTDVDRGRRSREKRKISETPRPPQSPSHE